MTSCLTGLDQSVLQIKTKIVSCHTAVSKRVKQEVNGTVILTPLVFPSSCLAPTLGVTKFIIVQGMILVTLCCATQIRPRS